MTKTKMQARRKQPPPAPPKAEADRAAQLAAWFKAHQRRLTIAGVVVAVIGGGIWFSMTASQRREAFARRELGQARLAAETGNFALAVNDLSRLIGSYGGTSAAEEAVLVLAQVRLLDDQPALAVIDLRRLVADGPRPEYRTQTYSLLGASLEQTGQFAQAGEAYLAGADGPGYDLIRADLLIDAGRAFAMAGDTARAAAAFERVLTEFDNAPRASEAQMRLGELRRFDVPE